MNNIGPTSKGSWSLGVFTGGLTPFRPLNWVQEIPGATREESGQKSKIMASGPITSWQIDGETKQTVTDFFSWAPKSLQMVTAAMELKDACSLGKKATSPKHPVSCIEPGLATRFIHDIIHV